MAIEAALQATEITDLATFTIKNFEFEDVLLSAALLVPEDDHGVEMLTSLRPEPRKTAKIKQWLFSVTSVVSANGDDTFTEHCNGKIGYAFQSKGRFSLGTSYITDDYRLSRNRKRCCSNRFGPKTDIFHQMV
jgi:hypothetical protein